MHNDFLQTIILEGQRNHYTKLTRFSCKSYPHTHSLDVIDIDLFQKWRLINVPLSQTLKEQPQSGLIIENILCLYKRTLA